MPGSSARSGSLNFPATCPLRLRLSLLLSFLSLSAFRLRQNAAVIRHAAPEVGRQPMASHGNERNAVPGVSAQGTLHYSCVALRRNGVLVLN